MVGRIPQKAIVSTLPWGYGSQDSVTDLLPGCWFGNYLWKYPVKSPDNATQWLWARFRIIWDIMPKDSWQPVKRKIWFEIWTSQPTCSYFIYCLIHFVIGILRHRYTLAVYFGNLLFIFLGIIDDRIYTRPVKPVLLQQIEIYNHECYEIPHAKQTRKISWKYNQVK